MSFAHRAQSIAFVEYRQAVSQAQAQVERLRGPRKIGARGIDSPFVVAGDGMVDYRE